MLPLATPGFSPDPLSGLLGALSDLGRHEVGVVQVLFQKARQPWSASVLRSVVDGAGDPFFIDAPEFSKRAEEKVSRPLFATVLRIGARSTDADGVWKILSALGGTLSAFADPAGNELVPLAGGEGSLEEDLLLRRSSTTGMLLGSGELAAVVHPPGPGILLPKLRREASRSKAAPEMVERSGVLLGQNRHRGRVSEVRLPDEVRGRHLHVIGASGTGKSTLLINLILQDIARGEGVGVLDPHGDLIDEILGRLPSERCTDVILFDPADETYVTGWNMLEARSELEKELLTSDFVAVFRRLSTSWGDQMTTVLSNAVLAFLESSRGGTLLDLRQFLVDPEFRRQFLDTCADEHVRFYWQREFPLLSGKPQGPILTRLDTFLRSKLVRSVVAERSSRLNFREMIDEGKIFLGRLSQGAIGEENAALLGSLLVSAFHQAALSRQELQPGARRMFHLVVDECQLLATPSMASLLSGARKYRLGLTLSHQALHQLEHREPEVASALLANAATRICFRVGEEDARKLERGFSFFSSADLVNLGVGEALCRMERSDHDFNLLTRDLPPVNEETARFWRRELREVSGGLYGRRRAPEVVRGEPKATPEPLALLAVPQKAVLQTVPREAPAPPAPLGRGGAEHIYLQELVKRFAEARGYRVVIEQPVLDGAGSVDVALERDGWRLACEISVTTSVEHEVGNVEKCLRAGFDEVACVSLKRPHLEKLERVLKGRLTPPEVGRVRFLAPEELCAYLDARPGGSTTVAGYKVKVRYEAGSMGERAQKSRAVAGVIARSVRRVK